MFVYGLYVGTQIFFNIFFLFLALLSSHIVTCSLHAMFLPSPLLYLSDPWSAISCFSLSSFHSSLCMIIPLLNYIVIFDKIVEFRPPKTVDLHSLSSLSEVPIYCI